MNPVRKLTPEEWAQIVRDLAPIKPRPPRRPDTRSEVQADYDDARLDQDWWRL